MCRPSSHAFETREVNILGYKILGPLVNHLLPTLFCRLRTRAAEEFTEKNLKLLLGKGPWLVPLTGTLNANLRLIAEFHLVETLKLRLQENVSHLLLHLTPLITKIRQTLVDLLDALIELTILANRCGEFLLRHLDYLLCSRPKIIRFQDKRM